MVGFGAGKLGFVCGIFCGDKIMKKLLFLLWGSLFLSCSIGAMQSNVRQEKGYGARASVDLNGIPQVVVLCTNGVSGRQSDWYFLPSGKLIIIFR